MAAELTELTNLLKIQNQNSSTNFKNLERVIEQVFAQMRNSLTGIKNLDEQQISIMRDSLNKELLEEQLIEKDIQLGDREIISALKEIEHLLSQQFDFDRESENKRKLSEHIQPDYQTDHREQLDLSGVEHLLRRLIDTTENISVGSESTIERVAEGFGIASLVGILKDIAFKMGSLVLKFPMLSAGTLGAIQGASGGSLIGSVASGGAIGLSKGGIPGAIGGAAVGAGTWAAGRMITRETSETDRRIGRWDDVGEPGSKVKSKKISMDETKFNELREPKINAPEAAKGLGQTVAKYESSKAGTKAVGYDKTGGTSYGKYQIASKPGTFNKFLSHLEKTDPEAAEELKKAGPANTGSTTGSVPETWKKLASEGRLQKAEHEFIKETHYDPAIKKAASLEYDVEDPRIQEMVWSGSVQHGGVNKILSRAAGGATPEEQIKKFYEERRKYVQGNPYEESLLKRYAKEEKDVLAMDTSEKTKLASEKTEAKPENLTETNSHSSSVEGKLVQGKPSGPIKMDGKVINPEDLEYKSASERLLKSKQEANSYAKAEKEVPEGKGYSEEESEIEEMDEPILEDPSLRTLSRDEEAQQTMDSLFGPEESANEQVLTNQKQQSIGMSPFGGIIQPTGGGLFGGRFGQQNPFGTIQGVLGGLGSAVGMGQSMGNMGSMGGIYGAQGALGGIQGMLGTLGMQSPVLGQVGQEMGSIGNVISSVQTAKNMGNIGGGGILGGINAASGVMGAVGSIFNAAQGLGSISPINQQPSSGGFLSNMGNGIESLFGFGNDDKKSVSSKGIGDGVISMKENEKIDSAALIPSPSTDGFSLEGTTQSVQTGKEEMMMPSSGEGEAPIVVNGGGGNSSGGGGGNSQANPSSAGVMGIDIGVRNEEASLLRAQYGSLRIV